MDPEPANINLNIKTYLYSDIYNIKVEKIIDSGFSDLLKTKYGDTWKEEVNKIYREIEGRLHENTYQDFEKLSANDKNRQRKAGLADLIPGGHKSKKKKDFNEIYEKILTGYYKENEAKMICSEFAAKTTIAAFVALDKELKKELGITDPNVHVIEMPFDKREKLSRMHPDRLIKVLQDKGCIEKQGPTPTQKKIFRE
ncbi:MAG: hypothetical protein ACK4OM_03285 [Alphaproteobacteria bacterium]